MSKKKSTKKKPSLKSQGARYSVTNRKGETTYYKSSKDAPGYNDTATGKGVKTSPGNAPVSRVDANGSPISSNPVIQAVGGTREQQLANAQAQMANIKSMLAEPSTKLTSSQSESISKQLGTASTELAKIPKSTAPTNAGAISTPMGETTVPDTVPDVPGVAGAVAGMAGLSTEGQSMADIAKQQADARLKLEEARQKETQTLMDKFLGKVTSPEEARQDAWDETGIDVQKYYAKQEAGIKEIESLTNEYNKIVAAKDQQIAQTQDAMGSMNFINNQIAQIERNAAPQLNRLSADINAKAATLQAQQGNYAEARAYVNDAVTAATADAKFKFDMFSMTYEMNQDNFDRIESVYADSFKTQMAIAQQEYEKDVADKKTIGELILAYNADGAGIKMTDTVEEAYAKAGVTNTLDRRLIEAQIANTWSNAADTSTNSSVAVTPEDGGRLSELFNLVVGSAGSVSEINRQVEQFNKYVSSGNTRAAQEMVNTLAVKNMTAEQKNRFVGFGNISAVIDDVAGKASSFAATNPGVYRTALESVKPFVNASTNPAWQSFVAETQNAVNSYRNEIFGASLTGNELKAANISLPNWNVDTAKTIFTKLQALKQYADVVREGTIKSTTGQYTSPALGQVSIPGTTISTPSVYDTVTGTESSGGMWSKFLNWLR